MDLEAGKYDAISFDCYGTLIDWDTGVAEFISACGSSLEDGLAITAFAQAQYRHQRAQPHKHYRDVLHDAFADMAAQFSIKADPAVVENFACSVGTWPPFPDTLPALRALKARKFHLAVLSNIDNTSFAATHKHLEHRIDTTVTAETVRAYKPDIAMFDALFAALEAKNVARERLLHVAQSRFHDVAPANALGLDVVWIDRGSGRAGAGITVASDARSMARFESLSDFVNAIA